MFSIPIYGSLAIQGYGIAISIGVMYATWCASRHPWCSMYLGKEFLFNLISHAVFVGILGGRTVDIITEPSRYTTFGSYLRLWEGGFAISGTIIALILFIPYYARICNISLARTLDLCALYAPLVHAIARVGCFSAGCCGGIPSTMPWALANDYGVLAHPTQLYSSFIFLLLFLVLRRASKSNLYQPGSIIALYLIGAGLERCCVDLWREDRIPTLIPSLSLHQIIALALVSIGCTLWYKTYRIGSTRHEYL